MFDFSYATAAQILAEVKSNTPSAASIAKALKAGWFVTGRIDELRKITFAPERDTHWYDVPEYKLVNERTVLLTQRPLLEVDEVTLPDGSTWTAGVEFFMWPRAETPRTGLLLASSVDTDDLEPGEGDDETFHIEGVFGWHSEYARAWVNVTALTADPDVGGTILVVTSAANLSEGMLLRLEEEYVGIVSISDNNVTVKRGIRGTTAVAHAIDTTIEVFQPESTIVRAAQRWAAMLFDRTGAFEQVTLDGLGGAVQFPPNVPDDVRAMLDDGPWNPVYERRGTGVYYAQP